MTKKSETPEPQPEEIIEDGQEMFMQMEVIDDQSIIADMQGHAIESYVYSFKQGGRNVQGLTLAGINEAANRRGGLQIDELQIKETDDSWIVTAKALDTVTNCSRFGACEQSKKMGTKSDPYAFTKAVHKAQRNALKQLIPAPVINEVLAHYLKNKKRR